MMFFPVFGILFLLGAVYNLAHQDYKNAAGTLVFAIALFAIYFARRGKAAADLTAISQHEGTRLRCCKCGNDQQVSMRAYLLTYSIIFFTSKSAGRFKPICQSCSVKAGVPYTLGTLLLGWWGIPWGPIYTVQAIAKNFSGGIVLSSQDHVKV
jgi:hypothetical protein